jgi:hypothetical protein
MAAFYSQLLIPLGAIIAAVIAAAATVTSLIVSKEQKVSEFRQQWIDSLRQDLARFSSNAQRVSWKPKIPSLGKAMGIPDAFNPDVREEMLRGDPLQNNWSELAQSYYSARLRLNPDDKSHCSVLEKLDYVIHELEESDGSERFSRTIKALDALTDAAQGVLKNEWKRVKKGEPIYRLTLLLAIAVIMLILIALLSLVNQLFRLV